MTEEEFKNRFYADFDKRFLHCVEDKIFENKNFLNLIKLQEFGVLYSWFYPLKEVTNFEQIVSLYYQINRVEEGRSYVWFLIANIHTEINLPERVWKIDVFDWMLVGDSDPIFTEEHKKKFLEHRVGDIIEITSYDFYQFGWEDVEFLADLPENKLIQDHCRTEGFQNQEDFFVDMYWDLTRQRDEKILERFSSKKSLTNL